jgi:hypothetical protein
VSTTVEANDDAPRPPPVASMRPLATLMAISAVNLALGSMLGASALAAVRIDAHSTSTFAAHNALTLDAVGVWNTIPNHAQTPTVSEWMADALALLDSERAGTERTSANGRRRASSQSAAPSTGITSDHVPAGPAQGFVEGRAVRITVTRIDGKPVEVRTALAFERMRAAAARDHVAIRIVSGFRTMEHQQALYAAYRRGRGNLAARPGESNHQSGHALDLNTSSPGVLPWLNRNAARFGFRRTVPSEAWHWEWW